MSMARQGGVFAALYRVLVVVVILAAGLGVLTSVVVPLLAKYQGYQMVNIMTGSMGPTIAAGSTVAIKTGAVPRVGDVVTMKETDGYLTHRVKKIDSGVLTTQGDANKSVDPWTTPVTSVVGVVKVMPAVLTRLDFLATTPAGRVALFAPAFLVWAFSELRDLRAKSSSKDNQHDAHREVDGTAAQGQLA